MTVFKKLWLQHRQRLARILRIPMILSVAIFTVSTFCQHAQEFMNGFNSAFDVTYWAICTYGTIITPLLAFRTWSEIFYDDAEAFSVTVSSKIWGGGALEAFEHGAFAGVFVFMLLGFLIMAGWKFISDILVAIYAIVAAFMLVVYVPMLIIGFILHLAREHHNYKMRRDAFKSQQSNNSDDRC